MTREASARAARYRHHGLRPGDPVLVHFGKPDRPLDTVAETDSLGILDLIEREAR